MKISDNHYMGALLEEINDRLKGIEEGLEGLKNVPADVKVLKDKFASMEDWQDIAKLVIKDQSTTLNDHETRLTRLEAA